MESQSSYYTTAYRRRYSVHSSRLNICWKSFGLGRYTDIKLSIFPSCIGTVDRRYCPLSGLMQMERRLVREMGLRVALLRWPFCSSFPVSSSFGFVLSRLFVLVLSEGEVSPSVSLLSGSIGGSSLSSSASSGLALLGEAEREVSLDSCSLLPCGRTEGVY